MRTGMYFNNKKCTREAAYSAARNPPRVVVVIVAVAEVWRKLPLPTPARGGDCRLRVRANILWPDAGSFLPRYRASREGVVKSRSCTDLLSSQLPARLYSVQTGPIHSVQLGGPHWLRRRIRSLIGGSQPDMESRERGGCRR